MTPTGERVEPELPAAEILDHVIAGRQVALVDVNRQDAVALLNKVAFVESWVEPAADLRLHRGHGHERLTHSSGGQLVPGGLDGFRGQTLDVAYVASELRQDLGKLEALVPALASTNGEIVWWTR